LSIFILGSNVADLCDSAR